VVLAVSLITGQNIALDTAARDVLDGELENYEYDFVGLKSEELTNEEILNITNDIKSIKGVSEVTSLSQTAIRMEIHNDNTLTPPKYGYYEKSLQIHIPLNGTVWLNTTLEPIPYTTHKVFGYVYSQNDGEPIDRATVEVREGIALDIGYTETTLTDENGYYEFFLPEAEYVIEVLIESISSVLRNERSQETRITVSSNPQENQVDFHLYDRGTSKLFGNIFINDTGELYNDSIYIRFRNKIEHENYTTEYYHRLSTQNSTYEISLEPGEYRIEIDPWKLFYNTNFYDVKVNDNSSQMLNLSLFKTTGEFLTLEGFVLDDVTGDTPPPFTDIEVIGIDNPYYNSTEIDENGYFMIYVTPGNISVNLISSTDFLENEFAIYNDPGIDRWFNITYAPFSSRLWVLLSTPHGGDVRSAYIKLNDYDYIRNLYNFMPRMMPSGKFNITLDARPQDIIHNPRNEITFYEIPKSSQEFNLYQDQVGFELLNGTFDPLDDEVVITDVISREYDLDVGDNISFRIRESDYDNGDPIWTFKISGIVGSLDFFDNRIFRIGNPYSIFINESAFDSLQSDFENENVGSTGSTRFYIKIDRESIIDPLSRDSTDFRLLRLLTRINTRTRTEYEVHVNNLIDRPLRRYYSWFERYRIEMLAYSLPVIAVGFYLGIVGVELATTQKRRSLGIIKSRGASDKQVFTSLILESLVLGIIAGAIGLIVGVVVSRFFLTIIPGARNITTDADFLSFHITSASIIMGIIFAIFLLVMASLKPAKRISKSPIIESIHQHTESGKEKEYKPGVDIFLVSFAFVAFIAVSMININDVDAAEIGQLFTILIFIIYIGSAIWLPFSPFVLMFSLTRLLTRGTSRVYKFFSRSVKPFSKDLWYIIHKNLSRNPKKVSMVSIIIALALGFGVFMTSMIGTTVNGQELEARARIGGDLHIVPEEVNRSFEFELEELNGVRDVISINSIFGSLISGEDLESRLIALFDSQEYRDNIEVDNYYFIEGEPDEALKLLSSGHSILVGEDIAQIYSLDIGDTLRIEDPFFPSGIIVGVPDLDFRSKDFSVVGIVRALPGLEIPLEEPDYYGWGGQIYMDFSAIEQNLSAVESGWRFLVNVKEDPYEVETGIEERYETSSWKITNLEEEIDEINNNLSSRSILYLMFVNIGFLIIIITVGLGLIMFISIGERKNEFATIMARGAEGKQMGIIIMGEALSITLVGAMVGVFSGILTAYTFNRMLSANTLFGISGGTLSDRPLVIPWYTILIILIALLALILTSALAAYRVKRIKLHSALRIRGG
jgi:ABC-type lipoprotein release transport system permease subunit